MVARRKAKKTSRTLTAVLQVDVHFICSKTVVTPTKGRGSTCKCFYVPCCSQVVVDDEISRHLDEKVGRGLWMYDDWYVRFVC